MRDNRLDSAALCQSKDCRSVRMRRFAWTDVNRIHSRLANIRLSCVRWCVGIYLNVIIWCRTLQCCLVCPSMYEMDKCVGLARWMSNKSNLGSISQCAQCNLTIFRTLDVLSDSNVAWINEMWCDPIPNGARTHTHIESTDRRIDGYIILNALLNTHRSM